jgi:murein DD-endopeptidase MepM/ murein hydrolase activator NlpD
MIRRLLAAMVMLAGFTASGAADEAVLAEGRERSEAFLGGDFDAIWEAMTPEMRAALGSVEGLESFRNDLAQAFGAEQRILEEDAESQQGLDIYLRTSDWTESEGPLLMQWAFDSERRIAGFFVQPVPVPAESRFLDYQTKATLRLPFEGEWFVFWGGRTLEQNYHAADRAQRFALDFLILRNGASHGGEASELASYYCWGQPILAPAAGTVSSVVDGLPDQPIGQSDPQNPAGNHVVLDLGQGEFAFLGHMQQGSIAVQPGDAVDAGDELGRCGNSGNSSEPHLHFHLQTTPELATGEGLPAFFENYVADGEPVARGEPRRGQVVAPHSGS